MPPCRVSSRSAAILISLVGPPSLAPRADRDYMPYTLYASGAVCRSLRRRRGGRASSSSPRFEIGLSLSRSRPAHACRRRPQSPPLDQRCMRRHRFRSSCRGRSLLLLPEWQSPPSAPASLPLPAAPVCASCVKVRALQMWASSPWMRRRAGCLLRPPAGLPPPGSLLLYEVRILYVAYIVLGYDCK